MFCTLCFIVCDIACRSRRLLPSPIRSDHENIVHGRGIDPENREKNRDADLENLHIIVHMKGHLKHQFYHIGKSRGLENEILEKIIDLIERQVRRLDE